MCAFSNLARCVASQEYHATSFIPYGIEDSWIEEHPKISTSAEPYHCVDNCTYSKTIDETDALITRGFLP